MKLRRKQEFTNVLLLIYNLFMNKSNYEIFCNMLSDLSGKLTIITFLDISNFIHC